MFYFLHLTIFLLSSIPSSASLLWETSSSLNSASIVRPVFIWEEHSSKESKINGLLIRKQNQLTSGTSGVWRLETETGCFYKKPLPMYVVHEAIDSVLGSYLLEWLSDKLGLSRRFPSLYFAVNTKSGVIEGILSRELSGYQTIGSLYSGCKNEENWEKCQDAANLENIFYQDIQVKDPLSLFYDITLFFGLGDMNPGNVCSNFNRLSETNSIGIGLVDIDAILKKHANSETFERVRDYCEKSVSIELDQCARNLLNFHGYNPIALKNRHQDLSEIYFLETGDSALRGNKNKQRDKSIYSGSLCGNKIKSCVIDPYNRRRYIGQPPIDIVAVRKYASEITHSIQLADLLGVVGSFMDALEASYQREPKLFCNIIQQAEQTTGISMFKTLKDNAINLLTARYNMLNCISKSQEKTFFDLEQECSHRVDSQLQLDSMSQEERMETIRIALGYMNLDNVEKENSFWKSTLKFLKNFYSRTKGDGEL